MAKAAGKERVALFTPAFLEDLRWWVKTDRKVALRLLDLLDAVLPRSTAWSTRWEPSGSTSSKPATTTDS